MPPKTNTPSTLAPDELETDDIYQAAYYNLAGCEFKRRRKEGAKVYFVFSNPGGEMMDMREKYFTGAKVSAYEFGREIKRMKELCFT
jgi:hypothetical protein